MQIDAQHPDKAGWPPTERPPALHPHSAGDSGLIFSCWGISAESYSQTFQLCLCKDVSKELVELLKLFKCLIPVETCLDALENPIRALACTFKHLNTFENAFFDHLGIEGQGVSRGFVLLTHLLLPKEIFGFVCVVLMSHVTFPFHCITCVIPW